MFIMFVPDLGELAYCSGDVVVLSKEVAVVALGDAADLPISCGAEACLKVFGNWTKHTPSEKKTLILILQMQNIKPQQANTNPKPLSTTC